MCVRVRVCDEGETRSLLLMSQCNPRTSAEIAQWNNIFFPKSIWCYYWIFHITMPVLSGEECVCLRVCMCVVGARGAGHGGEH